jgi:diguanylate cyclase (GGDEF)-like protein
MWLLGFVRKIFDFIAKLHVKGRWLVTAGVVLAIVLWIVGGVVLWTMRNADWDKARIANANIVAAVEADIARTIEVYDLSLQAVVDNLRHREFGGLSHDVQRLLLFDRAATATHLGRLLVLDETGHIRFDNTSAEPAPFDYSGREYFQEHRQNPDLSVHISHVIKSSWGNYILAVSRRINHQDGSFAGVVVGALRIDYFRHLFEKINVPVGSVVGLVHLDGTVIARLPFNIADVGLSLRSSRLYKEAQASPAGEFESVALIDGTRRLYAYQQVGKLPHHKTVGVPLDSIYSGWFKRSIIMGGVLFLLGLAVIALACVAAKELRNRAIEIRRRAAAEARFALLASTDGLTGLANRRRFDEALKQECERARRQRTPLALLMIDADHFKAYNDQYGHQAGDDALVQIAAALMQCTREGVDVASRYGGEEFGVILPGVSAEVGLAIAERVRQRIVDLNAAGANLPTLSIGLAFLGLRDLRGPQAIVSAADAGLYQAKRSGRNRTCLAPTREPAEAAAA